MSTRSVRLCDAVNSNGDVCPQPFSEVCPLCDRDLCDTHTGSNYFGPTIDVGPSGDKRNLGYSAVHVCEMCNRALGGFIGAEQRKEFGVITKSIMEQLIETARALLAEKKLAESK